MSRYIVVAIAVALLLTGCARSPEPTPTAVPRVTEQPAPATETPPPAPSPQPTATVTTVAATATRASSPTALPTAAPTATAAPSATPTQIPSPRPVPPTLTPEPTKPTPVPAPTRTPAPAPAPAAGAAWKGEYFTNPDVNGKPVLVRSDANINFDWGPGSPDPSVPADRFSARWTRSVSLPAGRYRFHATSDDGVRVYVDGLPIIDRWKAQGSVVANSSAALSGGNHNLRVDYFDNTEKAAVRMWWESDDGSATDPDHTGAWRGAYFNNRDLSGTPASSATIPPYTSIGAKAGRAGASPARISRCAGCVSCSFPAAAISSR